MRTTKLKLVGYFGVDEAARRLKRYYYVKRALIRMIAGWEIVIPTWEMKLRLPFHLYQDSVHADLLRKRVIELRYPALDVDEDFAPGLVCFMQKAHESSTWQEAIETILFIREHLIDVYLNYFQCANPVSDLPSIHILQTILREEEAILAELKLSASQFLDWDPNESTILRRRRELEILFATIGGFDSNGEDAVQVDLIQHAGLHSKPFLRPDLPARDERFTSSVLRHNEAPEDEYELKVYRLRSLMDEMSAVEVLCGCLYDSPESLPWEFYKDMGRWIWDESRHCEMGFEAIKSLGIDPFDQGYINNYGSYAFTSPLTVIERICMLSLLSETATIPMKIGMKEEYEELKDALPAQLFDFDWADEAIHVTYGNRWAPLLVDHDFNRLGQCVQDTRKKWIAWGLEMAKEPIKNGQYGLFRYFHDGEFKL